MTTPKQLLFTGAAVVLCGLAADTLANYARVVYKGSNHCWVEDAQGNKLCEENVPAAPFATLKPTAGGTSRKPHADVRLLKIPALFEATREPNASPPHLLFLLISRNIQPL